MKNQTSYGTGFVAGGAIAGASTSHTIGNLGLLGAFGGVSVGAAPVVAAGAIAGSAAYGAVRAIQEGDPAAIGAVGIGMIGGGAASTALGGMGLAGSFGAVGIGMGTMVTAGGIVGLGLYGLARMLDSGAREPASQVFARMEDKIAWQEAYTQALIELTFAEDELLHRLKQLDVEDELQRLRGEVQRRNARKEGQLPGSAFLHTPNVLDVAVNILSDQVDNPRVWFCVHNIAHHAVRVNAVACTPDGQSVISGSDDGDVILWDLRTGNRLYTFVGQTMPVLSIAVSADGNTLAIGGADQKVTRWNLASKFLLNALRQPHFPYSHSRAVRTVCFSADGKILVSGSDDQTIRVWECDTGALKRTLRGHTDAVLAAAVFSDGKALVSGGADGTVRIWDLTKMAPPRILLGHADQVTSVLISPGGETIISGSLDQTIKFWDFRTGELLLTLDGHQGAVTSIAISTDRFTLASSSSDGSIRLWKVGRDRQKQVQVTPMQTLPGYGPIAFSPDGRSLVCTVSKGSMRVWRLQD
jgi:hypothetical protein